MYIKLGDHFEIWEGWTIDKYQLTSPEGEMFDPKRLHYFHWLEQIHQCLSWRINHLEQYTLFD